jgi:PAS domain S-box-containing protein
MENNRMQKDIHKKILLVEDESLIAIQEQMILEEYGYSVVVASSGESAIEVVRKTPDIDLILMDINLGEGIDGTDAARQILAENDIPLVFLSSHTERDVVEKTEGITSYGYIVKDSGETVLVQSIKMAFRLFNAQMSRQEKEELRLKSMVLDQIKDFVTITDTKGIITYVNKIQEEELGFPKVEMIGKSINIFKENPEKGATQNEILTKTLKEGSWRGEVVNYAADGHKIILYCRTQIIRDKSGKPVSLCGISTDITEQKKIEERLHKSEEKYRLIVEKANDGIEISQDDRIIFCNARFAQMLGYTVDELKNISFKKIFTEEGTKNLYEREKKRKAGELKKKYYETTFYKKDGTIIDVDVKYDIIDYMGRPATFAIIRDVTRRKQAEALLRESEKTYRELINGMNDTVWVIDFDANLVDVNKTAVDLLGYSKEELLSIRLPGIDSFLKKEHIIKLVKSMPEDKIQIFETSHRTKNGHYIPVEISSNIINFKGKKAVLSIARNISDRKKAEDKIQALLNEKELLLKETHHRIKNNMGIIKSILNLQAQKTEQLESREILKDAVSRVQSMMVLYDKLYRSEAYTKLNIKDFLPSLIHKVVALFHVDAPVKTEIEVEDIILDSKTLSTLGIILSECITNSMKYAFDSVNEPRITLKVYRNGDKTVMKYADNGSGYVQKKTQEEGRSFGLQLMDMLVQQLKGTVTVDGENGMKISLEF